MRLRPYHLSRPAANPQALNKQTLQDWLDYIESLHPEEIKLGLDRTQQVLDSLGLDFPRTRFITIAGTNGKGSTLAYLESIYLAAGYHVGSYTSPHLIHYNERVRVDRADIDDESLCLAFEKVEAARGEVPLTYFEFGTLATLVIFSSRAPDVVLLETGLGGRLDAVNVIDADLAIITSIALDHTEWLGETREKIGREKAGVFRRGRPAICSDPSPPGSIFEVAEDVGAALHTIGRDFQFRIHGTDWSWQGQNWSFDHLPLPGLAGEHQLLNASAALAALEQLNPVLPVELPAITRGLQSPRLEGRIEVIQGRPQLLLDVSHNPQAVAALAHYLESHTITGKTRAIIGMMRDKDIGRSLASLKTLVDHWYVIDLPGPRGASATRLSQELEHLQVQSPVDRFADAIAALQAAQQQASAEDRILVFGSFVTVGAIMSQL